MSSRPLIVCAAALLFATGCAVNRPIHYYTLVHPSGSTTQEKPDGPTILVAAIEAPEFLEDARIRYRAGANEAGAYELHRWIERPGNMVRDALVAQLRASGEYRRVLESSGPVPADYLVRGRLGEFGEVDNPAIVTRISLHLELVDMRTNRDVWDHLYEHEEPSGGKTIGDVVHAMDLNLQDVVRQAASDIGAFVASAH